MAAPACGGAPAPVTVAPPTPASAAASACTRLHAALPHRLEDLAGRRTTPDSTLTAAWGSPPVVLRCGVPEPPGYGPTSEVYDVDGVTWYQHVTGSVVRWTAVGRSPLVEVAVPTSRPSDAVLVDLGPLVERFAGPQR